MTISAFAAETDSGIIHTNELSSSGTQHNANSEVIQGGDADLWYYRRVNVRTYYQWSTYSRVSDNLATGPAGGSITCSKTLSYNASISGSTFGIAVGASGSVSSTIGYVLNVGGNQRVYMAFRVYNKIETGTREKYNKVTGEVVESNTYTATSPQYGEYRLINY